MNEEKIFNMHCFWKGFAGWIAILFIEESMGSYFLSTFIEENYRGGAHFYFIALPAVFILGSFIHNFKIILKKIHK